MMQAGYKDYLNHLNTRFIARRSDIIVSSTLSITLTPIDDGFEPAHFALINDDEIASYVMLRQEFRAQSISSNKICKQAITQSRRSLFKSANTEPSKEDSIFSEDSIVSEYFDEEQGAAGDPASDLKVSEPRYRLPATLLAEPMADRKVVGLSVKEQRLYKMQKMKYAQKQK